MTKTDLYIEKAKIIVAGLAVIEGKSEYLVVNLHSPHHRAVFGKDGQLRITNMSKEATERASKILIKNLKYLV